MLQNSWESPCAGALFKVAVLQLSTLLKVLLPSNWITVASYKHCYIIDIEASTSYSSVPDFRGRDSQIKCSTE